MEVNGNPTAHGRKVLQCVRVSDDTDTSVMQQTILQPSTEAAIFLVLIVPDGDAGELCSALADLPGLKRSVGFRIPEAGLSCVVGIGSDLWDRLRAGHPRPRGLHRFIPLSGATHTAVSTPGDLLFHIRAHRLDLCFELAQRIADRLSGLARIVDEVHGFRSFDERDLLGFVDGTENPEGEAAGSAITIGAEDPGFAGGSYVIVQKYLHDLTAWDCAVGRGAGASHRPHEAQRHRAARRRQAIELARRAQHDRR